jgi:glycosyltransferase 2 family protein
MKRAMIAAAALGLAGATLVVVMVGAGQVATALAKIGWRGLAALVAFSALPSALLGTAWFVFEKPWPWERWRAYVWARLARDASGELLPFSHVAGILVGARAAILQGLQPAWAFASLTLDVTTEFLAQIAFTLAGLGLLFVRLDPKSGLGGPAVAGIALLAASAVAFVLIQRRGMGLFTRIVGAIAPAAVERAAETGDLIAELHRRLGRFWLSAGLHFCAWTASALGAWIALRAAGIDIGALDILGLEALIMAVRSAVFVAPMGVGVQEAGYALLAPLFGLPPDIALALSLIKRARDLVVGVPVLTLWQAIEGRRLIERRDEAGVI